MHNWGNYYNSTKNPQFVSETCWSIESYSRPETLKEVMGLDVDRYDRPGWLKHWNDITGLPIINRFPYSSYFDVTSLRAYLRSLNIEQAFADFHALSNLRLHSPSNEGILYWSLNKGGPLFQFGCVDYLGYPLMSYYVTKRLFAGVVIQSYRDIGDIRIVGSNETLQDIEGILRVSHMNIDGIIINQWEKQLIMKSGATSRILDLNDYYHAIDNRLYEIIHAALISGDSVITEDVLLFAPFSEVAPTNHPIEARVKKLNKRQWEINLSSQGVVKMVELECDRKSLFSDNYFAMVPHQTKCLKLTALDREPPEKLTVHGVDSVFLETIRL
jgi:beta-mannosidase